MARLMTVPLTGAQVRDRAPRSGPRSLRAVVQLAWGVNLHTSPVGHLHDSVADTELIDPFEARPDLDQVVGTEQHGPDFDGDLLLIKRTVTLVNDGFREINPDTIAPPTPDETTAVHAALDYLGYTGPREIKLLITIDYSWHLARPVGQPMPGRG